MNDIEKIVDEVTRALECFGYGPINHMEANNYHELSFHVDKGSDTMCQRHKDAIRMLAKGYSNGFHYMSGRQYVYISKRRKGIEPDDDRYSCLIHEMIHVTDNLRSEEEVKGKELFINMYDQFERILISTENLKTQFNNAIDEYIEQSQESKQNEALTAEFSRITDGMIELYSRKNADYGNSFGRTYQELGIISAVTRMNDKMERLKRLATKPGEQRVTDESIDDTLTDLASYAVMTLMERRREKGGKS